MNPAGGISFHIIPNEAKSNPPSGFNYPSLKRADMGTDSNNRVTIRGRMDDRGRITIKEDDRIALGLTDLEKGERVLLEMDTKVLNRVKGESDD